MLPKILHSIWLSSRNRDDDGHLPLSYALAKRAPLAIVKSLLRAHPRSSSQFLRGLSAIHYALGLAIMIEAQTLKQQELQDQLLVKARGSQIIDVVRIIMKFNPSCLEARMSDLYDQQTPLHIAALYDAPPDVVSEMSTARSEAATEADRNGYLPIHIALLSRASSHR